MDFEQVVASASVLFGVWLYGRKSIGGPVVSFGSCLLWILIAFAHALFPLAVLNTILALMHLWNINKWSDDAGH